MCHLNEESEPEEDSDNKEPMLYFMAIGESGDATEENDPTYDDPFWPLNNYMKK